jgi:multisubunit Na+/H+ antiporter MnhC subunit
MSSNFARFTRGDKILVVAAFVALISLFLPWFQASVEGYTIQSVSGWGTGYGWMAALLLVAAGVYLVLQLGRSAVVVLALTGLGTFLILLRIGTLPHGQAGGGSVYGVQTPTFQYGAAAGIVLALLAGVIETVCAFLMFRRRKDTEAAATAVLPESGPEGA